MNRDLVLKIVRSFRGFRIAGTCVLAVLGVADAAHAGEVVITRSLSNGIQSGSVDFVFNDDGATTLLSIHITSTMTTNSGPNWLTGVFFNITGTPTMNYDPSGLGAGMITLIGTTQTAYTDYSADHFWGLRQDITSSELPFGDMQYGLASAGFGVFSESDVLNFQVGGPVPQLDGTDGGILANIAGLTVPGGHEGTPFVLGSLWLEFDLGSYDISGAEITDFALVFGTGFDEVVLIPIPMALTMGLAGLAGVIVSRKRLRRSLVN